MLVFGGYTLAMPNSKMRQFKFLLDWRLFLKEKTPFWPCSVFHAVNTFCSKIDVYNASILSNRYPWGQRKGPLGTETGT